ncbi:MAG: carbohydrate porin [bacterium]
MGKIIYIMTRQLLYKLNQTQIFINTFIFKTLMIIILLTVFNQDAYSQLLSEAFQEKVEVSSNITVDQVSNISGGIKQGSSTLALFDFSLQFPLAETGFLQNTDIHTHLIKTTGKAASENFIGDLQVASNIEGHASNLFYELLVIQNFKNLYLSVGFHDLNAEFMAGEYAGDMINSSFGITPSVTLNMPVSIFPITTFGGYAKYHQDQFDLAGGFYNMNYDFLDDASFKPHNHFFQKGYMTVGEARYRWLQSGKVAGEYKIGGYYKNCNKNTNSNQNGFYCPGRENYGIYMNIDQTLFSFSKSVLGTFIQTGFSPVKLNYASEYYAGGFSLRREGDKTLQQVGIGFGRVQLNKFKDGDFTAANNHETMFEATAKIALSNAIILQPDIQYIINPSGTYDNALTGIMRVYFNLM